MTDLLIGGTVWWAIPAVALAFGAVFGFFPGFVLRLLVLLYPADDPRRKELVAELYLLGRMERVEWVFQQLETALFEGISTRLQRRRATKEDPADEETPAATEETQESDAVRRRRFLAAAAAISEGNGSGSWGFAPVPGRIGMTDVRQVEAATRALRSLDYQYGGGFCREAVIAQLSWGRQMLTSAATDAVKKRLHIALADLHNLAGWTCFDVGLTDSARDYFRRALAMAKDSGAHGLVANVLYRLGRIHLHENELIAARRMFEHSQSAAQRSGSELAVAIVYANQAWVHELLGERERALRFTGLARTQAIRAGHDSIRTATSGTSGRHRADATYEAFLRTVFFPSAAVGQGDAQ